MIFINTYKRRLNNRNDWYEYIPILLCLSIVPLIIRMYTHGYKFDDYLKVLFNKSITDIFCVYKAIFIVISTILAILILLYRQYILKINMRMSKIYFPIIAYFLFILLSWITSKHFYTATIGYYDRYEGSIIMISYLIILVYAFNIVKNDEKQLRIILYSLLISTAILNLIGLGQLFGYDLLKSNIFQDLIMIPNKYKDSITSIDFSFKHNEIYQTLYNINYVGSYLCLVLPIVLVMYLNAGTKKKLIGFLILYILLFVNLLGCKSSGGFYGFLFITILLLILRFKDILVKWKRVLTVFLLSTVVLLCFESSEYLSVSDEMTNGLKVETDKGTNLQDIKVEKNKLTILYNGSAFITEMQQENNQIGTSFYLDDKVIDLKKDGKKLIFDDNILKDIYVQFYSEQNMIVYNIDGIDWAFIIDINGFHHYVYGKYLDDIVDADAIGFKGRERFGNSRGYIWSRTLPLIKNNILYGGGADTFIYQFPNNDYVQKYLAGFPKEAIIDKPHNMFLGIAINTGLLSLISVLFLFIGYFIQSLTIYYKNRDKSLIYLFGFGIFLGFCGYMVTCLVNDSVVSVAPVFWTLLGLGFGCNYLIKKNTADNN